MGISLSGQHDFGPPGVARNEILNVKGLNDKVMRVETGVFETGVKDTPYFSPDQQGGFFGVVLRQYFDGTLPASLTSGANVATLVGQLILFGSTLTGWHPSNRCYASQGILDDTAPVTDIGCFIAEDSGNLILTATGVGGAFSNVTGYVDYIGA